MESSSRPLFIFLKTLNMKWKQVVYSLVSIYGIIQTLRNAWGGREGWKLCYELLWELGGGEEGFSNAVT